MDHVRCGWLTGPFPMGDSGGIPTIAPGAWNVTFRFSALQMDKSRARADFKYGQVYLSCDSRPPIDLPAWYHRGKLPQDARSPNLDWAFFKADRQAAHKYLPLATGQSPLCIVALRCLSGGKRYGLLPRDFPIGAASAVLHYNCFSRILAVLASRIFACRWRPIFPISAAPSRTCPRSRRWVSLLHFVKLCAPG